MTKHSSSVILAFVAAGAIAASCGALLYAQLGTTPSAFAGVDVSGQMTVDLRVRDTAGNIRTLADFRGKPLVVYFGFLNCPDACPSFLSQMKAVGAKVGAASFNVALVTVDPKRDSPTLLRRYLDAFDESFVGLVPSADEVPVLLRQFKAFAQANPASDRGYYTVDHTTYAYVFDGRGMLRLIMPHDLGVEQWVSDFRLLIADQTARQQAREADRLL